MSDCRICQHSLELVCDFGRMPIANGFLSPDQFATEYFFPLQLAWCPQCCMTQLVEQPAPDAMFHGAYPFFTGSSLRMRQHFGDLAATLQRRWLDGIADPFVVELGSNDGTYLENFSVQKIRHCGIEPSGNVADVARAKGVTTQRTFFSSAVARDLLAANGPAHVISMANVLCHIPSLHDVFSGFATLLDSRGVVVIEDPYWPDIVRKTTYDQIYDEHVFYFSLTSMAHVAARHGLELIDAEPQWTHGGSMRCTLARRGAHSIAPAVQQLRAAETALGIGTRECYTQFAARCAVLRTRLRTLLAAHAAAGQRVAGYGATSKSTTILNYCGIGSDRIAYICDTTPLKQGKVSPGMHIPIRPHAEFAAQYPDVAVLFAWNHAEEILAKETAFTAGGGEWLHPFPDAAG